MSLWEQVEGIIGETINFSKQAYEKAREIGSITKKEFEIKGLQSQVQKVYTRMGAFVHQRFSEDAGASLLAGDETIQGFMVELDKIDVQIREKELEISALRRDTKPEGTVDATPSEDA